jgi:hypothetical protein
MSKLKIITILFLLTNILTCKKEKKDEITKKNKKYVKITKKVTPKIKCNKGEKSIRGICINEEAAKDSCTYVNAALKGVASDRNKNIEKSLFLYVDKYVKESSISDAFYYKKQLIKYQNDPFYCYYLLYCRISHAIGSKIGWNWLYSMYKKTKKSPFGSHKIKKEFIKITSIKTISKTLSSNLNLTIPYSEFKKYKNKNGCFISVQYETTAPFSGFIKINPLRETDCSKTEKTISCKKSDKKLDPISVYISVIAEKFHKRYLKNKPMGRVYGNPGKYTINLWFPNNFRKFMQAHTFELEKEQKQNFNIKNKKDGMGCFGLVKDKVDIKIITDPYYLKYDPQICPKLLKSFK